MSWTLRGLSCAQPTKPDDNASRGRISFWQRLSAIARANKNPPLDKGADGLSGAAAQAVQAGPPTCGQGGRANPPVSASLQITEAAETENVLGLP